MSTKKGKFRKKSKKVPTISAASLPDIVFMLLIFFMVSTTMREVRVMVQQSLPEATEVTNLERRSLVSNIYIGSPQPAYQDLYGTSPRIQLDDSFADVEDIAEFIASEREEMDESEIPHMTTSLRVDEYTTMGVVTDVKQALRRANALRINYSTRETEAVY